ncbi:MULTISPECIES: carbohydrate ABC transporter permease [Nocardiopsis]|uniref:Binding-protein-dependent transport systems inner membrane component n=1 Tax=Nocardiopsis dassonvillei (strain ATCC 23218 / DSM 43111 / CIP 107115 / JCM 7437 / KCTC 9190 / NBRC 14626 / NCTC 10488 / NRRL B-5397 / IMRU 509) TaxID=446468 RepID=D7AYL3_NOCDD|nr:sugar ABC transporter permease [Nocardiopsis dassonvillei]ADH66198.1 binding-protein-dependent transport systems inner membrane component [Nocardiopsis dassonvillei subsp. dassonvillei DSM 43111]APC34522.1 sugar ABC transporter permease [Nocardiopsis dassonvillei]NKY78247.1 sugar ABC transporter permease [Nocardiopsis dassonvillei]VEI92218.1 sn-glycerol-3-phosphate transport system permease protein ugpA [Nocardiopsis dassonvillei]
MTAQTPAPPRTAASGPSGRGPVDVRRRPAVWTGLWFVLPFLAFYLLFLLWPALVGLVYSFTDRSLAGGPVSFVGLDNWRESLTDPDMWDALWNTLWFTVLSVPLMVALALALALLTDHARRLGWFLRLSFFAPFVLPVAVMTLVWNWMYNPSLGLFNGVLGQLGLDGVEWLFSEDTAMLSVVVATAWWQVGFNYLLYLAAMQSIPKDVYEAAAIDGAGAWQRVGRITLPMLARTTALITVLQLIGSLRVFEQIYLMTSGGPNFATRTAIQYIYDSGFVGLRIGLASSMAYVFMALVVVASIAQFRLFARKEA